MKVFLVGIGMGGSGTLTLAAKEAIEASDVLIGAKRMLEPFAALPSEKLALYKSEDIVGALADTNAKQVCVILSGDVGFYSGATKLREALMKAGVEVESIPGIATPVYLSAKVGIPWEGMLLTSLHGREEDIVAAVRDNASVFALTGGKVKAQDVCRRLTLNGYGDARVHVGERLSYTDERIVSATAAELAESEFGDLAALIVERSNDAQEFLSAQDSRSGANVPRLLIAAPASGGGKTTFACALLAALKKRGLNPAACKTGPDYIDPAFHRSVLGVPSVNLDLFFSTKEEVRHLVADNAVDADVTIIESAMGYYDGIGTSDEASGWHVAQATETPTVLVVDARGRARSVAAEVKGFCSFRRDSRIAAVVLNRVSKALYPRLKELVESETGVAVAGYIPVLESEQLPSRHLGLVMPEEVGELSAKIDALAAVVEQAVDIDVLLDLARKAALLEVSAASLPDACVPSPKIAVARDEAFCFYYQATFDLLEHLGAKLVEFSPIHDKRLPEGVDGLYLGGGYPELHAEELSANHSMLTSVREAIEAGLPTVAECGGFLYLHETLEDAQGVAWPMAGVLHARAYKTDRLGRFGYITMTAAQDGLLAECGDSLKAHEFHYWDSEDTGHAFHAQKPQSGRGWECSHMTETLYAGFPHLYLPSNPNAALRFVDACARFMEPAKHV